MLQQCSLEERTCLARAADCETRAQEAFDPEGRERFRLLEATWRWLARSHEFTGRLNRYCQSLRPVRGPGEDPQQGGAEWDGDAHNARPLVGVVDDDAGVRGSLERLLRSAGFRVQTFANAEDFLRSERALETACLILDVHLPGISGPDLQAQLVRDGRNIRIIFITADADEVLLRRSLSGGAHRIFLKPVDPEALLNALATACGTGAAD